MMLNLTGDIAEEPASKPSEPLAGRRRRSSLFEIPAGFKPSHVGSSIMSFGCEPRDDHFDMEGMPAIRQKKVFYDNTYQMEPSAKFRSDLIIPVIKEVLANNLEGKTYNPIECSILSKSMADEIKKKAKRLNFQRYKLVCLVTIGEKKDQGVRIGSRCVWDTERDTFASASFENPHLYAVGVLHAFYYE